MLIDANPRAVEQSMHAHVCTGLRLPRGVDHASHARLDQRAGTHGTRLERDVDGGPFEAPASKRLRGFAERQELGMGRGILQRLAEVAGASERAALVHDERPDRHVAEPTCSHRERERFVEPPSVFIAFRRRGGGCVVLYQGDSKEPTLVPSTAPEGLE